MSKKHFSLLLSIAVLAIINLSEAKLIVVSSTTDLASIAQEIGGDLVEVRSIALGQQDVHEVEILPSFITAVQKADLYLKVGMGLDFWSDKIIQSAENSKLKVIDCSEGIKPIEEIEHHGDHFHEKGNPHYWLGVDNLLPLAENISKSLIEADSLNAAIYSASLHKFVNRLDSAIVVWKSELSPYKNASIIVYHESWNYFARDFYLNIAGVVESRPGVSPSALHLAQLETLIKDTKIKVLLKEPYFTDETANLLADDTGISVIIAPTSVAGVSESKDIFSHFNYLINQLVKAFSK